MRKRELTHGDLFHVYIASDAPQEVCDFLTQLRQHGDFSYEILQIIGNHVKQLQHEGQDASHSQSVTDANESPQVASPPSSPAASSTDAKSDDDTFDPVAMLRRQRRAWVAGK